MAEEQDDSQKTEEATDKRLEDAREKGDVPKSQEIKHAVMLGAGLLTIMLATGVMTNQMAPLFVQLLGSAEDFRIEDNTGQSFGTMVIGQTGIAMALPVAILFVGAVLAGLAQGRPVLSWERVKPKLNKISPIAGFGRIFGAQGWIEFLKVLLKVGVVGVLCVLLLSPQLARLEESISYDMMDLLALLEAVAIKLFVAVVIFMAGLGVLDFIQQRFSFLKRMRMSRQELKDEFKQSEGDPLVKAKLRQIRMERSRKRMMAAVPEADVVITNPTHFAVALKYDHGAMAAPRVVAKGVDTLALKIREIATQNAVPIVENPPLARALYATVEIDAEIQPDQYKAVAEVISYVMKLRGRLSPKRGP
jgi:flagellar biosynthesis protein FlhB